MHGERSEIPAEFHVDSGSSFSGEKYGRSVNLFTLTSSAGMGARNVTFTPLLAFVE